VTVVGVERIQGDEVLIAATEQAHVMLCQVGEVNYLSGPGKGVIIIKIQANSDRVLGFTISKRARDRLVVETSRGGTQSISTAKYEVTGRGGKGRVLLQRAKFIRVVPPAMEVIDPIDSS
jgi:DNA gyrase subunit A